MRLLRTVKWWSVRFPACEPSMRARWAMAGALGVGLMVAADPASAQSCSFTISNLDFGSINLAANTPFTSTATYSASCTGTANTTVRTCPNIDVGSGGSTSGSPRFLLNGATQLSFNLYQDAAHSVGLGLQSVGFRRLLRLADDRCRPQRQRHRQRIANGLRPDLGRPADLAGRPLFLVLCRRPGVGRLCVFDGRNLCHHRQQPCYRGLRSR